jgi:ribosomal protein L11 methyltransferase
VRSTQAQFAPLRVAERLWIVPTWCEPVDARAVNLVLDPGLAFGTGSHPTTRLCLRWLERHVRGGERVLDYGCGSGILAIAASRLGAGQVLGVDIDPDAVAASRDNAGRNGVDATFCVPAADPGGEFDLVAANILANPLTVLAPAIAARVRPGGRLVLAGLLEAQAAEVAAAYAPWFNIAEWAREEGWVALEGVRRGAS